jgi:hypothetical protein
MDDYIKILKDLYIVDLFITMPRVDILYGSTSPYYKEHYVFNKQFLNIEEVISYLKDKYLNYYILVYSLEKNINFILRLILIDISENIPFLKKEKNIRLRELKIKSILE